MKAEPAENTIDYQSLERAMEKITRITNVINILHWDIIVNIPTESVEERSKDIVELTNIVHDRLKNLEAFDISKISEVENLDAWRSANIKETARTIRETTFIDEELRKKTITAGARCECKWRETRKNSDYESLKPYLQEVLSCTRQIAIKKAELLNTTPYDALIDIYDPDGKECDITPVFDKLKKELPSLISLIVEKQKSNKILPLPPMDLETQKRLAIKLMKFMEFDFTKGRIDESEHPMFNGTSSDLRITNRYRENNMLVGVRGVMHETGHALYEYHLPEKYKNQPVGKARGMSLHESQSLFMENQVGKTKEFCYFLAKLLRDDFNMTGEALSENNLHRLQTRVTPSLIRVEADEVTYPMHVILRYEIEKALIDEDISLDDLPGLWNTKMKEYLNITPTSDAEGCLQDIHWTQGSFGYFPSYTNGAIIASMLMDSARKTFDVAKDIQAGDFSKINSFLTDSVRKHGSLESSKNILLNATGSPTPDPDCYIRYLKNKFLNDS